jgi:alanyl-tRNA synthetase
MSVSTIAHIGDVVKGGLKVGQDVTFHLDTKRRMACMQNHTGTHLLNGALHRLLPLVCQRSSYVGPDFFKLDVNVFDANVNSEVVTRIENIIMQQISENRKIERSTISCRDLSGVSSLVTVPGERYPEQVHIISLPESISEPCCGTHVLSTSDVQAFTIVNVKTLSSGVKSFRCLTGNPALKARDRGIALINSVSEMNAELDRLDNEGIGDKVVLARKINIKLSKINSEEFKNRIPYTVQVEMTEVLEDLKQHIRSNMRLDGKQTMLEEIDEVLKRERSSAFVAHAFTECTIKVDLSKISQHCGDSKPILVIASGEGIGVVAKACVPQALVNDSFDATSWLTDAVSGAFGGSESCKAPRGQDGSLVCNMIHIKKVYPDKDVISKVIEKAQKFALDRMVKTS